MMQKWNSKKQKINDSSFIVIAWSDFWLIDGEKK